MLAEAQQRARARLEAAGVWAWTTAVGKITDVPRSVLMEREDLLKPMYRKFFEEEKQLLQKESTSNGAGACPA